MPNAADTVQRSSRRWAEETSPAREPISRMLSHSRVPSTPFATPEPYLESLKKWAHIVESSSACLILTYEPLHDFEYCKRGLARHLSASQLAIDQDALADAPSPGDA